MSVPASELGAIVKLKGQFQRWIIFLMAFRNTVITSVCIPILLRIFGWLVLVIADEKIFCLRLWLLYFLILKLRSQFFAKTLLPYTAFWTCRLKVIRGLLAVFSSSELPLKGTNGFAELVEYFIEAEISLNLNFSTRRQWKKVACNYSEHILY